MAFQRAKKRPTLTLILTAALFATAGFAVYKMFSPLDISQQREERLKRQHLSYFGLELDERGLLKNQQLDPSNSGPKLARYTPPTELKSPIPQNIAPVEQEFLMLTRPEYQKQDHYFANRYSPVEIGLGGELASTKLSGKSYKLNHVRLDANREPQAFYVSFQSRLNHKTGNIFWSRVETSSGKPAIDRVAERILRKLQFERSENEIVSRGVVSMVIRLEKGRSFPAEVQEQMKALAGIDFQLVSKELEAIQ